MRRNVNKKRGRNGIGIAGRRLGGLCDSSIAGRLVGGLCDSSIALGGLGLAILWLGNNRFVGSSYYFALISTEFNVIAVSTFTLPL